jgi:hypothetical protein
MNTVRVTL